METPVVVTSSLLHRVAPTGAIGSEAKYKLDQMVQCAGRLEQLQEAGFLVEIRAAVLSQRARQKTEIRAAVLSQRARQNVVRPQASATGVVVSQYHATTAKVHDPLLVGAQGCN